MNEPIWLVGVGEMAIEYAKVLTSLEVKFCTIGRSESGVENFKKVTAQSDVVAGGLASYLETNPKVPAKAIVAVGIESLTEVTIQLIRFGVKEILLEKPGIAYPAEIFELEKIAKDFNSKVLIAYNRRFYSSVMKAQEIIKEDGGVRSFCFEFTEWSHVISKLSKTKAEHENWFLGNSTHVIDLAFFLGGKPTQLEAFYQGSLDWHPASAIFSGSGRTELGALFSYHANWESPGRWWLDILTKKHRLIFKPVEGLKIQTIGSVAENSVALDASLDELYKPGLYLQTKAFLERYDERFVDVAEQADLIRKYYLKMSGYAQD